MCKLHTKLVIIVYVNNTLLQVSYKEGRLQPMSNNQVMETVRTILKLPVDGSDGQPTVTVSLIQVVGSERRTLSENMYILLAEGNASDLPRLLIYHDPRNMCVFQSLLADSQALQDLLNLQWPNHHGGRTIIKHMAYSKQVEKEPVQIRLDVSPTEVHFHKSWKKCATLEFWSHERKPKALSDHLISNPDFCNWVHSLRNTSDTMLTDQVFGQFFSSNKLPTSFKYATIHFRLTRVAGPNQLGVSDTNNNPLEISGASNRETATVLHMKNDNGAHIKFTHAEPYVLSKAEIENHFLPEFIQES